VYGGRASRRKRLKNRQFLARAWCSGSPGNWKKKKYQDLRS
jgi:hypothetical protein